MSAFKAKHCFVLVLRAAFIANHIIPLSGALQKELTVAAVVLNIPAENQCRNQSLHLSLRC